MQKAVVYGAGGVAAVVLSGSLALAFWPMSDDPCSVGAVAGGSIGGPFELVSETGQTVTQDDVIDKPSLIYFGYTFCPDVCPIDSARNAAAVDILAEQGVDVRPIFITVDPERDTVEVVGDYTDNFHPQMIGLTGSTEQVDAAAKTYRVVHSKADDDPEFYLVNHSVFTYFVTPEDGFVDFFRREAAPEQVAETVSCYLS